MTEQKVCPGLGKLWEPQHPECAGGPDPAFINPVDGGNERPRCPWFAQCAAATNARKLSSANATPAPQNVPVKIPSQQMQLSPNPFASVARGLVQGVAQVAAAQTRQPAPLMPVQLPQQPMQQYQQPQVPVRPPQWQPQYQQPQQQFLPQQFMQVPQYGQVPMVPPQMAMMPHAVPMNMPAPGSHMMGYLAVPEPYIEGQHWASRLGFSVLRSMFKASGHTVANFFDYNTFGAYPPEGG